MTTVSHSGCCADYMYLQVGGTLQVSVDNEVMVLAARRVVLGGTRVVKTTAKYVSDGTWK